MYVVVLVVVLHLSADMRPLLPQPLSPPSVAALHSRPLLHPPSKSIPVFVFSVSSSLFHINCVGIVVTRICAKSAISVFGFRQCAAVRERRSERQRTRERGMDGFEGGPLIGSSFLLVDLNIALLVPRPPLLLPLLLLLLLLKFLIPAELRSSHDVSY